MKANALIALLLGIFAFLYVAEGVLLNPFAIWNAAPLVVFYALHARGSALADRRRVWGAFGFLLGSMAVSIPFHVAWMLNLGAIRTGSSTSALALLFIPIHACIAGGIGFLLGWCVRHLGRGRGA
ncbi:hypothetical protein [Algiphilus sp.]|uniref:hypothetical protein n=1 Tax=Algiphilus sp. TaxID=1872431 RepID=UPI0025BC426C|nr:hypothetical protein [Algiphilus sp.]MCK5770218.1 hypothetical protein [Algiphilus sp.]